VDEVGTKSLDEVRSYMAAFWERGPAAITDFDKQA
jgi:hypothetical protein